MLSCQSVDIFSVLPEFCDFFLFSSFYCLFAGLGFMKKYTFRRNNELLSVGVSFLYYLKNFQVWIDYENTDLCKKLEEKNELTSQLFEMRGDTGVFQIVPQFN